MAAAIQLLGQCTVARTSNGAALRIERQEQALLTYLLLHGKAPLQRERVIETFWPERPSENGCRCLSTALWRLHKGLTSDAGIRIESSRSGWIKLCLDEEVTVDLWEFRRCSAEALHCRRKAGVPADVALERLEHAAALYRGALCPHLDYTWLVAERSAAEEQYLDCLSHLADVHDEFGDHNRALAGYRQMLAINRTREDAHARMMEIFWRLGSRERAIRQYEQCAAALRADLDVVPMPETQGLLRAILDGSPSAGRKPEPRSNGRLDNSVLYARVQAIQARVEHAQLELAKLLNVMATDEAPLFAFMLEPNAAERGRDY